MSEGNFFLAAETLSRTCCSAYLTSVLRLNSAIITETFSKLFEESFFKPGTLESSSSYTFETNVSTSSGPAPG